MTALNDLFPDGPRVGQRTAVVLDDTHTRWRLRETIGEPRTDATTPRPLADTRELADMVEAARRTAVPFSADAGQAPEPRRPKRRFDALTVSAGALAVIAVVVAATVGGIQMATASPAASALESLRADEAAIQNAEQSLTTASDRLTADIEAQAAAAATLRLALVDTSTVPDPAADDGSTLPVADEAALTAAVAAIDVYIAGLAAIEVPAAPAAYDRGTIDEDSLVAVGSAIDDAQQRLVALDEATADLRTLRTGLDALRPTAALAVSAYTASYIPAAVAAVTERPDAEEELRTAVTDAAALVASSDPWAAGGQSALAVYRDAFLALAADQLRAEIEQDQSDSQRQQGGRSDGGQAPPSEGSTDPAPVDPVVPVDPVDPIDPVDPETPPEGGGTP